MIKSMKMNMKALQLLPIVLLMACSTAPTQEQAEQATPEEVVEVSNTPIGQSVEAHGGIAVWKSYKTLAFDLNYERNGETTVENYLLNLQTRHEHITGNNYEMGYDGTDYWQLLKEEGMKEKNPTFMINLQFYFFAMPFVLADPGVIEEKMPAREIDGKAYDVVKITFESGTGVASDDQYIVYLDPETKRMEAMLYSVTYFNKENAEKYNALRYTEWQEVGELVVPKSLTRYTWDAESETFGEAAGTKTFTKVRFSKGTPDPVMFAKPEGAL